MKITKQEFTRTEVIRLETMRKQILTSSLVTTEFIAEANTYWEELTCVGFNPQSAQLEAVISLKRATGYNGSLCTNGSTEYVRFFIDWGNGAGYQDVGLGSFKAHDISNLPAGPQHPLKYMVYLNLDDNNYRKCCDTPVIPKVKAVLSWNQIPSLNPDDMPQFGNSLEVDIQIEPSDIKFACLLKKGILKKNLPILDYIDLDSIVAKSKPAAVAWTKLIDKYKEAKVPEHRLTYEAIYPMLKGETSLSFMAAKQDLGLIEKLDLNIGQIIDTLAKYQGNTTYEELTCVGLNTATDTLGAVIHVKKPSGYSGNLCQNGSKEYVAFWADWDNNGTYDEYLGRAEVTVHDLDEIPDNGLFYCVSLPANFTNRLKTCNKPNIIRIRAVLSWAVPPSEVDSGALNHWGNRRDAVVQIRPKVIGAQPVLIYDVGNVAIENISPVTHLAYPSNGALNPANCALPAMDRPFGKGVRIGGRIYNTGLPGTVHYQVQYVKSGGITWLPVTHTNTFELMHPNPADPLYPKDTVTINSPDGWFPYLENPVISPPILERTARLAVWNTGMLEGAYKLRIAYTKDYPITPASVIHYSNEVVIILDNTNFTVSPTPNSSVDMSYKLDLVIDGGDCHTYAQEAVINGHLRARDKHFWKWALELQPTTHTGGAQASPRCRTYGFIGDQGANNAAWSLDTHGMDPCGYTLTLRAYDRTIVNSNGAVVHWNKKAVGFSIV